MNATVTASDGQSGLGTDPSGTVPIATGTAGPKTVTRTAIDNVGHSTTRSCTTNVGYFVQVTGPVSKLVVRSGEAVLLTSTGKVNGNVTVKPGGALDIEGGSVTGRLTATSAALLRICGASITGAARSTNAAGSVVIGEGKPECAASTFSGAVTLKGNTQGVVVNGNVFHSNLKVMSNANGVSVINNKVTGSLTVLANTGGVTDKPNEVGGKSNSSRGRRAPVLLAGEHERRRARRQEGAR